MKLTFLLTVLPIAAASALSSRQLTGAPQCLVLCSTQVVTSASGGCSPLDTACYCQDPTASSTLLTCVEESCPPDEVVSAWNLAIQACGGDINDDTAASASAVLESAAAAATSQVPISAEETASQSTSGLSESSTSANDVIVPTPSGSAATDTASRSSVMTASNSAAPPGSSSQATASSASSSSSNSITGAAAEPSTSAEPSGAAQPLFQIPPWFVGVGALAGVWIL